MNGARGRFFRNIPDGRAVELGRRSRGRPSPFLAPIDTPHAGLVVPCRAGRHRFNRGVPVGSRPATGNAAMVAAGLRAAMVPTRVRRLGNGVVRGDLVRLLPSGGTAACPRRRAWHRSGRRRAGGRRAHRSRDTDRSQAAFGGGGAGGGARRLHGTTDRCRWARCALQLPRLGVHRWRVLRR